MYMTLTRPFVGRIRLTDSCGRGGRHNGRSQADLAGPSGQLTPRVLPKTLQSAAFV
jgi:hypothetical protein